MFYFDSGSNSSDPEVIFVRECIADFIKSETTGFDIKHEFDSEDDAPVSIKQEQDKQSFVKEEPADDNSESEFETNLIPV